MRLRYPWSVLEIEPTSDEKAIRKAYAAKLRVTRPDEDPEGFQALLEARDVALMRSRHMEQTEEADDAVPAEPDMPADAGAGDEAPWAGRIGGDADPGVVMFEGSLTTDAAVAEDAAPDVGGLLAEVGAPHPWRGLAAQWAGVFDMMEQAPLAEHSHNMWIVLQRLVDDIRQQVGTIPDVSTWQVDLRASDRGPLGAYAEILRDFERRFGILRQDTVLLDYLGEEEARDFINALTIAAGREAPVQATRPPSVNVEPIEAAYVNAAWEQDAKMRNYYALARDKDAFPVSFSWLALFFPLPFALYHRLNGLALLLMVLIGANTLIQVLKARGMDAPLGQMATMVYLVTAGAFAFNWRRIRVQALASKVRQLTNERLDRIEIKARLGDWSRPSPLGMWAGVAVLVVAGALRIYAR